VVEKVALWQFSFKVLWFPSSILISPTAKHSLLTLSLILHGLDPDIIIK
jgi:hypothetical protein